MATILGLNAVIGAGIFTYPAALACTAGPAGLITFSLVVVMVLLIAMGMARMALTRPTNAIFYDHAALWAGKFGGITATLLYAGGLIAALGLMARMAGSYLTIYAPALSSIGWGSLVLVAIVALSFTSMRATKWLQIILIVLTILPLVLITALCASKASIAHLTPFAPHGVGGIIAAIKIVLFGFFGFEAIPAFSSFMRDPQKNIPRAMILTIILTGIIYFAFIASIMLAIPHTAFTSPQMSVSPLLLGLFPTQRWLVACIDWAIIITIIGTLHSMLLAVVALITSVLGHPKAHNYVLLTVGALLVLGCISITNIGLSFGLAALGISAAYAVTLVPLTRRSILHEQAAPLLGSVGIAACAVLFMCGLFGAIGAII